MFRAIRNLSQSAMSLLPEVFDRRDRLLYLWHMFGSHRFHEKIELGKIQRIVNLSFRDEEGWKPRCSSRVPSSKTRLEKNAQE